MTDTSKLNAEAAAISKQSSAIRAFAIDQAANSVQQAGQIAALQKAVAALQPPPVPQPTGNPVPPPPAGCYLGAYIEGVSTFGFYYPAQAPWSNAPLQDPGTTDSWAKVEADIGKKLALIMFGQPNPWLQPFQAVYFDACRGAIPVVDMMTGATPLVDISGGKYDAQITAWATAAKQWAKPFVLRLDCEMNGTWYDYGAQAKANPAAFVAAWRHIHDLFTAAGATNVSWHWCPNIDVQDPGSPMTPLEQLYPGDAYVDWTGYTGYNHGGEAFSWLFDSTYARILALAPSKPMMIGEIGSVDVGHPGEKVAFINTLLTSLPTKYPAVRGFCWFNWRINEGTGWWDWPVESSPQSIAAFRAGVAAPYYVGRP